MKTLSAIGVVIVTMSLCTSGAAPADSAFHITEILSITSQTTISPRRDCWIEHIQVQPARAMAMSQTVVGNPSGVRSTGGATHEHLGSEHWTARDQRACEFQFVRRSL